MTSSKRAQTLVSGFLAGVVLAAAAPRGLAADAHAPTQVLVFAASSLTDVLPRLAAAWRAKHHDVAIKFNFEASSSLARQIASGGPADLFFSADEDWVEFLEKKGLLAEGTRVDVAGNALVVVVPAAAEKMPKSAKDLDSLNMKIRKIAIANENVPSAKYARQALETLHVWKAVEPKLLRAANVRASLSWVVLGEADAAIVYATDALVERRVKVAFVFPQMSYPIIRYAAAEIKDSKALKDARAFLEFCRSADAAPIWRGEGFREAPR